MHRAALAILAASTVAAGYLLATASQGADAPQDGGADSADSAPGLLDQAMSTINRTFQLWRPPAAYAGAIAATETRYGIPVDLLARQLYQECHWRADVIDGSTSSPAGALGIAQFMPATAAQFGIDPLDPAQAIDAAGRYMAQLERTFGNWTQALAAYNWGQGNVARKGLAAAPAETRAYFSQILADVNAANGTAIA